MRGGTHLVNRVDGDDPRRIREAQQVFDLTDNDGDRDIRREARRDGIGHKADERSQFEEAHEHELGAGDDRCRHQAIETVRGNDGSEGGSGARHPHAATAEQRDKETSDEYRIKTLLGGRCQRR